MPSQMKTIARNGSGAHLNATLYREWHDKVKRYDKLEAALKRIAAVEECWGVERRDGKRFDVNPAELAAQALANTDYPTTR